MIKQKSCKKVSAYKNYFKKGLWTYDLMFLPGLIFLIIFNIIPMYGIIIAFQDYVPAKGVLGSQFNGLFNLLELFDRPEIWHVIWNTFKIALLKIFIGFPIPIIFALLLNEIKALGVKKGVQTIVYLPNFISWVIMAGVVLDMFATNGGIINNILNAINIKSKHFLDNENYFVSVLILTDIWKGFGWGSVIYLATIAGIDSTLYEAAIIDGAKRFKQTIHVTLPGMMPIIVMSAVLNLGNVLNAGFDQIYNLQNDLVSNASEIIDTFSYKLYKKEYAWSQSTLIGLLKSIVSAIFIITGWKLASELTDYSVF